ncbi:MAG: hypothetical protein K1Y02_18840 [Candidatus Hydrogenedentes bacterium]|nr:hypothetical protein [Candidatus Hydrogenedentota bacterium]
MSRLCIVAHTKRLIRVTLGLHLLVAGSLVSADELDIPFDTLGIPQPAAMMRSYLLKQVEQATQRWQSEFDALKPPTQADTDEGMNRLAWDPDRAAYRVPDKVASYQARLRSDVLNAIGGLPERTPLEPQIVGTIARNGYRIEKVIFQSQPFHYVTALLYLPDAAQFAPPYPGVLIACGHAFEGKASEAHQTMGALMALNGMAALVFDPIEQGERIQGEYPGHLATRDFTTSRHTLIGMGCILLGQSAARFEIWDSMRALDYLASRPEVDPARLGCAGNSGGGTQTAYLMALDDRISCAAPSCSLTTRLRLLANPGAQDSEQNIFGQLRFGVDDAHWILMRAPSPVLVCAAAGDGYFSIDGTWESFRYAKRLFTDLGFPERVEFVESNSPHGYHITHREATARWMSRWLLKQDRVITEPKIEFLSKEECLCTPGGNVMSLPGARSVYDLNLEYERALAKQRADAWNAGDSSAMLANVRQLVGIRSMSELPKPRVESCGAVQRPGYRIEKLALLPEEGIALPALLFVPEKPAPGRVVLYLHDAGKSVDAAPGGPIEQRALAGETVLAVDLRGMGQTRASDTDAYYTKSWQDVYTAYLLGRSYVGMRAEDILICARYASERLGGNSPVALIAVGNVGIPALHAAALEPDLFDRVSISRMLVSWSNVIERRLSKDVIASMVHGALTLYDIPDLAAALGNAVSITESIDAMGEPYSK